MTQDTARETTTSATLGDAFREYMNSLKPDQQHAQETYVRRCVEHFGEQTQIASLTGSRIELFAEAQIRASDPNAPDRVNALKQYFQFIRKRGYATENFGIHIRVRRPTGGRTAGSHQVRVEESPVEMTRDGLDARSQKLEELQARRPDVLRSIATAREDKDFRENAPLQAAREELAMIDGQIKQIEAELRRSVVVERTSNDLSAMGSQVTVTRLDNGKSETFTLSGGREANAKERKISVESPVGKELLGRRAGDEVEVVVPNGTIHYRIDKIVQS